MRYCFIVGIALLIYGGVLSSAQSPANPPAAQKSPSPLDLAAATQTLPKVCSKTNLPPSCATPPRVVSAPAAEFSEQARGKDVKGVSVLGVIVKPDGTTSDIHVIKALGMGLDEKAIDAVKRWKFKPAMLNGKPVAVEIAVEVDFHLY
jgi:TonB family protein